MKKPKIATAKDVELNRWCIEMAMRWPTLETGGYGMGNSAYGQTLPRQQIDADVLGRAQKIHTWVKSAHQ